jgi:hypothetical protein
VKARRVNTRLAGFTLAAIGLTACGYHVAGRANLMPKNIRTIAIPAFGNLTPRYRLPSRLPADLAREFRSRTRYEVVADPNAADATLTGAVINYYASPTVVDQASGRPAGMQVTVVLQLRLAERESGKVLFDRQSLVSRERYELSVDQVAYFEESEVALERLSRDVARTVVSAILENF